MDSLEISIKNFVNEKDDSAILIKGEWGVGKTYYVKKNLIPKYEEKGDTVIYFSIYGYSSFLELKQDIIYELCLKQMSISDSQSKRILNVTKDISKFMKALNKRTGDSIMAVKNILTKYYATSVTNNKHRPIIIIDDLERNSNEISMNDFLGFISSTLINELKCRVILIGNTDKIKNPQVNFEKVISRVIPFEVNYSSVIQELIIEKRNQFLCTNVGWIMEILIYLKVKSNHDMNLRTLKFVINTFEMAYNEINTLKVIVKDEQIFKTLFLNILFISVEMRNQKLSNDNLQKITPLLNTRSFMLVGIGEEGMARKIIDNYHGIPEIDDNVMYSEEVTNAIFFNRFDASEYLANWKKIFLNVSTEDINKRMNNFRDLTDESMAQMEREIITSIREGEYTHLEDFLKALNNFLYFDKSGIYFIEDDYKKLLLERISLHINEIEDFDDLKWQYSEIVKNEEIWACIKKLFSDSKKNGLNSRTLKIIDAIFNNDEVLLRKLEVGPSVNIFKTLGLRDNLQKYIFVKDNKVHRLIKYINIEYMRVSNAKQYHSNEIVDLNKIISDTKEYINSNDLGKMDFYRITELINKLEELIEHLS
ncbi:P-loop NTPase fold protein [Companilactobacillus sp. HBUAS59544]|uniref:P-loop NTPase fold protein n=1 Tax=Companilactobacillus sp. HBUAS59544 TaxID=3109363 RepID=UPI002FEEA1D3